jgi:hypothetical protein
MQNKPLKRRMKKMTAKEIETWARHLKESQNKAILKQ